VKKFLVAMGVAAFAFVGCDDSSSAPAGQNDEPGVESSSSVEQGSSSSEKAKSSSSDTQSETKQSSSSEKSGLSSSSSKDIGSSCSSESDGVSSSSVKSESSSSVETPKSSSGKDPELAEGSSSSEAASESSSGISELSSNSLKDFDWSLPKETYLNPEIEYDTIIDSRDGKVYKTVKIGDQTWMAENLNFDPGQGGSGEDKYDWSWCYNDEPANCDVTGRFYTWAAAIDSVKLATDAKNPQDCGLRKECRIAAAGSTTIVQGVCPPDWHLPTETEWSALFTAVDRSTSGEVLRSQTGWHFNKNGTDAFGFSALPAGRRYYDGRFDGGGADANFWSATENGYNSAHVMRLYYNYEIAYLNTYGKDYGFSVRCVKNE